MKPTGIVRKVDNLGRIVIPMELRQSFSIEEGDPLEIYVDDDKVILAKYQPVCIFCGKDKNLRTFKKKKICSSCRNRVKNTWYLVLHSN